MSGPVLIAILEYGELPEMLRTARIIGPALDREVVFFFVKQGYRGLADAGAMVERDGFRWIAFNGRQTVPANDPTAATAQPAPPLHSVPRDEPRITPRAVSASVFTRFALLPLVLLTPAWGLLLGAYDGLRRATIDLVNLRSDWHRFSARQSEIAATLARHSPALVIVGQSSVGSELDMTLLAASDRQCPTLIVPFAMFNLRELAEFALARPDHAADRGPANLLLARFFPHWAADYAGRRLLRLPGSRALGLEFAGLTHGHPWVPCSMPVDALACESEQSANQFRRMGVEPTSLHIVGSPVHDRLAQHLRTPSARLSLLQDLGCDDERPILLCGWPANIFSWLGNRKIEFPNYDALAIAWTGILQGVAFRHGLHLVISAHPKSLDEELNTIKSAGGLVVRGDTERLIAACDVFCTLNGSSITAWAIAACKPAIIFDCYATGYVEFDDVPGLVKTETEQDFATELDRVCASDALRRERAEAMRAVAPKWAVLDGCADERLAKLARRLVSTRAEPARKQAATVV